MKDYRQRVTYQRIGTGAIASAAATLEITTAQTDQLYKYVTGVAVSVEGDENALQNSVFNKFQIDGNNVFSKDPFEAKFISITKDTDVAPNAKFYDFVDGDGNRLLYPAAGSKVDFKYTDGSFAGVSYTNLRVNVWLRLENIDEAELEEENRFMRMLKKLFKEFKD